MKIKKIKKKILIIEDDKNLVRLLKDALPKNRYEVLLAIDGQEGLSKAKKGKPDLIILDILLPGKSGFDVLEEVKSDSDTKKIPVLILSNLGQEQEIQIGMNLGAADYLIKADFTINDVVKKVNSMFK